MGIIVIPFVSSLSDHSSRPFRDPFAKAPTA